MTKQDYLDKIEENKKVRELQNHIPYRRVVEYFLDNLQRSIQEGSTHVRFPMETRGATVGDTIYPPKTEECLLKAKELYPWLDIEVHYKPCGDFGGTLRVIYD